MNKKISTHLFFLILLSLNSMAQVPWKGTYGNDWLVSGKKYVRLAVTVKGIQQVNLASLPEEFKQQTIDHEYLQLWHRGVQVDILSSDATKVIFYAEPNDGKFDELLCRPYSNEPAIVDRMNKHVSLFSDEGAYFLVLGAAKGFRAIPINSATVANPPVTPEPYHLKTDVTTYKTDLSHSNSLFIYPTYLNSFYEYGKTFTGVRRFGNALVSGFPLNVKKLNAAAATIKPKVKLLLHSRGNLRSRDIRISIGPDASNLRQAGSVNIAPFRPKEFEFDLQLNDSFVGDVDAAGVGTLAFQSNDNSGNEDIFSVSYYSITYPQNFDMQGSNFYVFNIPPTAQSASRINLAGLPGAGTLQFLDITDPDHPKGITNAAAASFAIPRANATFNLLATTVTNEVLPAQMSMFTFTPIAPANFDYIVITTEALSAAAQNYANYRAGTINPITKQSYKPIVLKIKDVYNQFNYGEPSPVAVRRCVDFLLSDGKRANKYLFLIGNSTTYNIGTKNLENEVPSIGYPGSDLLLVSGLGGESNEDIPAIPHGRLPTSDPAKVAAYLTKVQQYENLNNPVGLGYRKNVVHVSGGKSASEITTFSNNLANAGNDFAASSTFGADVFPFVKDIANPCPPTVPGSGLTDCQTWADPGITTKVNDGTGTLSYYGHGNPRVTDYYYGYVSDNARGYTDNGKYSAMFFYGCDVNNVFRGFNENVSTVLTYNQRRPFTVDWLLTPNRGSVVVVGNTWEAYESILTPALDKEYSKVFTADHLRKSIGNIVKETAVETLAPPFNVNPDIPNYNYNFVQANVHQTLILGDPAIVPLLTTDPTLPVELVSFTAKAVDKNKVEVKWTTASEKDNSHFIVERSEDAKTFSAIGVIDGAGDNEGTKNYVFYDNEPLTGVSYYRLAQVDQSVNPGSGVEGKKTNFRMVSVEIENPEVVVISPNPSPSTFEIQLDSKLSIKSWDLLDSRGRTLHSNGTGRSVDLAGYPSGTYYMEIVTDKGSTFKRKLVKK